MLTKLDNNSSKYCISLRHSAYVGNFLLNVAIRINLNLLLLNYVTQFWDKNDPNVF